MKTTIVKTNHFSQMKKLIALLSLFAALNLSAQQIPVVIQGATIHTGTGIVIENGYVVFGEGRIMLCAQQLDALYKNARIINAQGKHVYPGLICMNTCVGLNEIDAVRATHDFHETGSLNPNVRSLIAYNTDSKVTPTVLSNGVLLVQAVPQGGLVSGTSSVMRTSGWNWEDAAYKADDGVHINWPELVPQWWNNEKPEELKQRSDKELRAIEELFEQAQQYVSNKPEVVNVRFEAMRGVLNGSQHVYVHVNSAKGIVSAIRFMNKYPNVNMVLVGASESYKLKELIKGNNIPVVLSTIHRLPQRASEDADQPFKTPYELTQAGITVAIGLGGSWETRNVAFNAGTAAAYGLSKEEALMCITRNPAKILGIDQRCGTLEKDKDATLIISSGDVLDMKSSVIEQAFINGEEVNLDNTQKQLYRRYADKYGIQK